MVLTSLPMETTLVLDEVNNVMIDFAIDYGVEDVALELICRYNHVQWFL